MTLRLYLMGLAAFLIGLDRWSKDAIAAALPLHSSTTIIPGVFNLVHTRNTGIAFSLFADAGPLVTEWVLPIVSAAAVVVILALLWRGGSANAGTAFALTLVLAGAAGNLYDRAVHGYVTDFLDFYAGNWHWPAFNVADSSITLGAGLLLFDAARKPASAEEPKSA